jgi:hypothetical protein
MSIAGAARIIGQDRIRESPCAIARRERRRGHAIHRAEWWLIVVVLLAGAPPFIHVAQASCYAFDSGEYYKDARAVFVGTVLATNVVRPAEGSDPADTHTKVTLRIERRWKGARQKTTSVTTCGGDDVLCVTGADFAVGGRYFMFAFGAELDTSVCSSWRLDASDAGERQQAERILAEFERYVRR